MKYILLGVVLISNLVFGDIVAKKEKFSRYNQEERNFYFFDKKELKKVGFIYIRKINEREKVLKKLKVYLVDKKPDNLNIYLKCTRRGSFEYYDTYYFIIELPSEYNDRKEEFYQAFEKVF